MTTIKNKSQLKRYVHYNQYTGQFTRIQADRINALGAISGTNAKKKGQIKLNGFWYALNRLAFLYMTGEYPKGVVHHIDGNKENTAWDNLNDVLPVNSGAVTWIEKRRRYQVYSGKKYVGVYKTKSEAEAALSGYINGAASQEKRVETDKKPKKT